MSRVDGLVAVRPSKAPKNLALLKNTFVDIVSGLTMWPLWTRMGWMEVRRRYRRTFLGPFWATASMAIFIGALGILYATLWNQDVNVYVPYLTTGFLVWVLISTLIIESCMNFVQWEVYIKQKSAPYTLFVCTTVYRNLVVFVHHLLVYVVVVLMFDIPIGIYTPLALVGVIIIAVNGMWIGYMFGIIGARFRDIPQLVMSVLQIMLFVTPILWPVNFSGRVRTVFVDFNPIYHFIEIVRAPLLGHAPTAGNYIFVAVVTVVGWIVGLFVFNRARPHVVHWL